MPHREVLMGSGIFRETNVKLTIVPHVLGRVQQLMECTFPAVLGTQYTECLLHLTHEVEKTTAAISSGRGSSRCERTALTFVM